MAKADFFKNISNIIQNNEKRLSYGVSVTDFDKDRNTIGVSACDIDQDGFEEIYFLNTDTYSGEKKYSDR